jgi:hypothetical protein
MQMLLIGNGVKWFWGLTCEFAGVFEGVLAKKTEIAT